MLWILDSYGTFNTEMAFADAAKTGNCSEDQVRAYLIERWPVACQDIGLTNGQVVHLNSRVRGFHFIGMDDLLAEIKPPDWLLRGYMEKNMVAQLVGRPNAGKSLLALDWAMCVATGTAWNGIKVDATPVCYINGEGHAGMRRRMKAWSI